MRRLPLQAREGSGAASRASAKARIGKADGMWRTLAERTPRDWKAEGPRRLPVGPRSRNRSCIRGVPVEAREQARHRRFLLRQQGGIGEVQLAEHGEVLVR